MLAHVARQWHKLHDYLNAFHRNLIYSCCQQPYAEHGPLTIRRYLWLFTPVFTMLLDGNEAYFMLGPGGSAADGAARGGGRHWQLWHWLANGG